MKRSHATLKRGLLVGLTLSAALLALADGSSASAPKGQFSVANGVVTDGMTGLKWQRTMTATSYTQVGADGYCKGLGGAWRLPSIRELATLVDFSQTNPATDTTAFPAAPATYVWSSSMLIMQDGEGTPTPYPYMVDFTTGAVTYDGLGPNTTARRVRCVQ